MKSVIPTLIQEVQGKPIETKVDELASLPELRLTTDECAAIEEIGNNKGCMDLKGANPAHIGEPLPDRWSVTPDHEHVANKWAIDPKADLACTHKAVA